MELITGYAGRGHVTSAQTGATNASIFGSGQFILNVGNKMEAEKVDNNHVTLDDGYGINQGRFFATTGENLTIETGTSDSKREDLIVARYERANSGVETVTVKVIKGTAGADYTTPSYVEGDILAGDAVDEMILFKVHLDGNEIDEIITVASIASVMTEKVDKESGKGLSTNDYTTAEKEKLAGVEAGATNTTVENSLTSDSTTNALSAAQGKALNNSITKVHKGYVQTTSISPASGQSVALTDLPPTYTTIHAIIPYAIQPTGSYGAIAYCTSTNVSQKNMYIQTPSFSTATDKFNVYYIIIYS